jgi:hypothetical protein
MSDMSGLVFAPGRNSSSSGAPTMSQSTSASVSLNTCRNWLGPTSTDDEVKLLGPDVLVKCIGAVRRQPPKPRAENLTLGPLQKIRVGNLHHVGRPPMEIFRLDQKITVYRFHCGTLPLNHPGPA